MVDGRYIEGKLTEEQLALFGKNPLTSFPHPKSGILVHSWGGTSGGEINVYPYANSYPQSWMRENSMEIIFREFNRRNHLIFRAMDSKNLKGKGYEYYASSSDPEGDYYKQHAMLPAGLESLPVLRDYGSNTVLLLMRGPDVVIDFKTSVAIKPRSGSADQISFSLFESDNTEGVAKCVGAIVGLMMSYGERGSQIAEDAARRLLLATS